MENLTNYINDRIDEGVLSSLGNWFKNLFKSQAKMKDEGGKAKPLSIDIEKQLKGQNKPDKIDTLLKNKAEIALIKDKTVGFPEIAQFISNPSKNFTDSETNTKYDVQVFRFFDATKENNYCVGYLMFDGSVSRIEGYYNILCFETLDNIKNTPEVQKTIFNTFNEYLKKNNVKGMLYKKSRPGVWASLVKNGFKLSNENRDWLIKQVK